MFNFDVKNIIEYLQKGWYKKSTLVIFILILTLFLLWFFSIIDFGKYSSYDLFVIIFILFIAFVFWEYTTKLPKAKKDKLGFIVAINYDSKKEKEILTQDFIDNLKQLINQSNYRSNYNFIEYPQFYSQKIISPDAARYYLFASRAQFMIYGSCKKREINGKEHHVLNLDGIVAHRPIPKEVQNKFTFEFKELFPKKLLIPIENDLISFEFTSELIHIISKYIISLAALISGDVSYSQKLLEEINVLLSQNQSNIPSLLKIKKRLPNRLLDVYITQARIAHLKWRNTHDSETLEGTKLYLDKIELLSPNEYLLHLLKAIYYFAIKNIPLAKAEIRKCQKVNDIIWRFSYAFLFAYEGNLKQAYRIYKAAFRKKYSFETIFEVEEFIIWVLNSEPEKYQLYFCLGLLNYYAKEDFRQSEIDLNKFIELADSSIYKEEIIISEEIMSKINE